MKKKNKFELYIEKLSTEELDLINNYFKTFNIRCIMGKSDNKKLRKSFEDAIMYYDSIGKSLKDSLELLSLDNLGGFYARPAQSFFPLDDAAKIYPVNMRHGVMSVFRLAVNLKEEVVPEILQMALNFTIKRFPSFATTLKKGIFWHYLDSTKRCFVIQPENGIPCRSLKVSQSGSQSFRVLYFNNRISVEFFHVLTDASGGLEFLKSLVSEYIRLTGVIINNENLVLDINENPSMDEFENEFKKIEKIPNASGLYNKTATQMTGDLTLVKPCQILNFKLNSYELKNVARKYNCTVTTYILALMFIASKASCEVYDGEFSIQVPVNMRKFYNTKTLRNFSMYCGVRLAINEIKTLESIIPSIVEQLKQKSSEEEMHKMLYATKKLIKNIRLIPLVIKQPIAKIIAGLVGDLAFTTTLSNIGVVVLPNEYNNYIKDMEFTLNTSSVNRASAGLITYNDTSCLSITKITKDPSFETKIYEMLLKDGLNVIVEGSELYAR